MNIHLKKEFRFEASHQLPNHDGKCANLHGHSWVLDVWWAGQVNVDAGSPKEGMVIDYADIKASVGPIVEMLDHHHLGSGQISQDDGMFLAPDLHLQDLDFPSIPTSENILIWIADQLVQQLPEFNWQCLAIRETCTSEARLYAVDYAFHKAVGTNRSGRDI